MIRSVLAAIMVILLILGSLALVYYSAYQPAIM